MDESRTTPEGAASAGDRKKKVMIAIDESEFSGYALEWALVNLKTNITSSSGLILFTAMAIDYSGVVAGSYGAALPELTVSIQANQKKFATALLERAKAICAKHGIEAITMAEFGNPRDAICDAVEKFDVELLVMGSHGRGAIQRALLGSVSNYCVQNAKCPVLVVKKTV